MDADRMKISLNTFFAVWWSKQPQEDVYFRIDQAVNARFIMNNVLSRAPFRRPPYLIKWPTTARQSTYRHLPKIQPDMLPQITRACIYAGYRDLFDELLPQLTPDKVLLREAEHQGNLHFRQALQEKVQRLGIVPEYPPNTEGWKGHISDLQGSSTKCIDKYLSPHSIGTSFDAPYDGWQCDAAEVELLACLPDVWKIPAEDEANTRELDYVDWPPSVGEAHMGKIE